jgi:hypothetical protein
MDSRRLEDVLQDQGVLAAIRELGLDPGTVFRATTAGNPYRHHRWLVKRTPDKLIVNAIPEDADQDHLFWEEWYAEGGRVHHHVLSRWSPARYDAIFEAPARDDEHPPLSFGKRWYVIDDPDMRAWLLRR